MVTAPATESPVGFPVVPSSGVLDKVVTVGPSSDTRDRFVSGVLPSIRVPIWKCQPTSGEHLLCGDSPSRPGLTGSLEP